MAETKIQWTDHSINPIRAWNRRTNARGHYCEKVSHGCTHCYASNLQKRFQMPAFPAHGTSSRLTLPMAKDEGFLPVGDDIEVYLDESKLEEVRRRKKPTKYFWCDMTDMFGSWVPDEWINCCFRTMIETPWHTHQVLTKRAERMQQYVSKRWDLNCGNPIWRPAKNIWLGVSVEDQQRADERIPLLLRTPAAVRFLSVEPLLGPIEALDFGPINAPRDQWPHDWKKNGELVRRDISWCIVGGESGPHARPMQLDWARSIRDQCKAAGVPFFFKQAGSNVQIPNDSFSEWPHGGDDLVVSDHDYQQRPFQGELIQVGLRDRKGGTLAELPADLRIRDFPKGA